MKCTLTMQSLRTQSSTPKLLQKQCKSVNAALGAPRYKLFAQLEELSDDDNNEDEYDMDGEETEVGNAMHQMSFDDHAEHAFSGLK